MLKALHFLVRKLGDAGSKSSRPVASPAPGTDALDVPVRQVVASWQPLVAREVHLAVQPVHEVQRIREFAVLCAQKYNAWQSGSEARH